MTHVAPRIVNNVSFVTRAQYLVKFKVESSNRRV